MKKRFQALLKNQKGLTLVELLAVVVILGIIAAIAIPSIAGIIDNSKKDAHVANAEQMIGAARLAVAANDSDLWKAGTEAAADPQAHVAGNISMKELVEAGYIESEIEDPDNSSGTYSTAFVQYDEDDRDFFVHLAGSKRSIGTAASPESASGLDRGKVGDND